MTFTNLVYDFYKKIKLTKDSHVYFSLFGTKEIDADGCSFLYVELNLEYCHYEVSTSRHGHFAKLYCYSDEDDLKNFVLREIEYFPYISEIVRSQIKSKLKNIELYVDIMKQGL